MGSRIDLEGAIVIVTGGSQGLGEAMASGLARAGARVVIASIDGEGLERVASQIGHDHALPVVADISKEDDCARVVQQTLSAFGALTALVNNARRTTPEINRPFWEHPVEFWEASVRINIFGTYLMTRAALPAMLARKSGRIINISTSADTMQRRHYSPYGVTKAAIDAETTIWAKDLAGTGVTVNTLVPGGACDTRPNRSRPPSRDSKILPASVMIDPVVWLASDHSSKHTGQRFVAKHWNSELSLQAAAASSVEPSIFRARVAD
jgi:3-oxoacyl-[acyl-carrier protein] reductase